MHHVTTIGIGFTFRKFRILERKWSSELFCDWTKSGESSLDTGSPNHLTYCKFHFIFNKYIFKKISKALILIFKKSLWPHLQWINLFHPSMNSLLNYKYDWSNSINKRYDWSHSINSRYDWSHSINSRYDFQPDKKHGKA